MSFEKSNKIISTTRAVVLNRIANSGLVPGWWYFMSDNNVYVQALTNNTISSIAKRTQRIVKYSWYTPQTVSGFFDKVYIGIYGQAIAQGSVPVSTTTFGGTAYYAIWGGRMWQRNSSGADTPGSNQDSISGGWTVVNFTDTTEYETKIFEVGYDIQLNVISYQKDDRNNIIINDVIDSSQTIDITDWGNILISHNNCRGIFNNFGTGAPAIITQNNNFGFIYFNKLNFTNSISFNSNFGGIFFNTDCNIESNQNTGDIYLNDSIFNITRNFNKGDIDNNVGVLIIGQNSNNGSIRLNTNGGSITLNGCLGAITENSNSGEISQNVNTGNIDNNDNNGDIFLNANTGSIFGNSNDGQISGNVNLGLISGNINDGNINFNSNLGIITSNLINGNIQFNQNNGDISSNNSNSGTTFSIQNNQNNGDINWNNSTANIIIQNNINNGNIGLTLGPPTNRAANITDTTVNK